MSEELSRLAWVAAAGLAAGLWAQIAVALTRFRLGLPRLHQLPPERPAGTEWPRVSIVVPSRDERQTVEAATRTLLALDYPALELIAVDDRSADGTGALLDTLAGEDPRLVVVHVEELPAGWLGKNHACHLGAERATGEWLLFTDGDVLFAPDSLRRAVGFALSHRLHHLVAFPHLIAPGFWERAFQTCFGVLLSLKFRTWELRRPRSHAFVGVGAFNLVSREAYDGIGGHRRLAYEVVDDGKLGLVLRRSGYRQGAIDSGGLVRVRWNPGLVGSLRGLMKNAFAAVEFSWLRLVAFGVGLAVLALVPLLAAIASPDAAVRRIALATLLASIAVHGLAARLMADGSGLEGLTFPLCGLAVLAVLVASAVVTVHRGGVVWRGTRYPLDRLRAGCVREGDWALDRVVGW